MISISWKVLKIRINPSKHFIVAYVKDQEYKVLKSKRYQLYIIIYFIIIKRMTKIWIIVFIVSLYLNFALLIFILMLWAINNNK